MRTVNSDIWILQGTHALVIPTNLGWKSSGHNVMGAGLALQAVERCTDIPRIVGNYYRREHKRRLKIGARSINEYPPILRRTFMYDKDAAEPLKQVNWKKIHDGLHPYSWVELIFIPSKKLMSPAYLSWRGKADFGLVRRALRRLKELKTLRPKIAVPLIGAGNGKLPRKAIRATIEDILGDDDRFTMVRDDRRW